MKITLFGLRLMEIAYIERKFKKRKISWFYINIFPLLSIHHNNTNLTVITLFDLGNFRSLIEFRIQPYKKWEGLPGIKKRLYERGFWMTLTFSLWLHNRIIRFFLMQVDEKWFGALKSWKDMKWVFQVDPPVKQTLIKFYRITRRYIQMYFTAINQVRIVTVYEHVRCYGGEEEGGWWYSNYNPIQTHYFLLPWVTDKENMEEMEKEIKKEAVENGWDEGKIVVFSERFTGEYADTSRHMYE